MTKIVVLSDTHIPSQASELPTDVVNALRKADVCIHAGDFACKKAIDQIQSCVSKLIGVKGNMDDRGVTFPEKVVTTIEGVTIGIMHGQGAPQGLLEYISKSFAKDKGLDMIIFGHSHQPFNEVKNGIVYFNPGSSTDTVFAPVNTYGLIELDTKKIVSRKIIEL